MVAIPGNAETMNKKNICLSFLKKNNYLIIIKSKSIVALWIGIVRPVFWCHLLD